MEPKSLAKLVHGRKLWINKNAVETLGLGQGDTAKILYDEETSKIRLIFGEVGVCPFKVTFSEKGKSVIITGFDLRKKVLGEAKLGDVCYLFPLEIAENSADAIGDLSLGEIVIRSKGKDAEAV